MTPERLCSLQTVQHRCLIPSCLIPHLPQHFCWHFVIMHDQKYIKFMLHWHVLLYLLKVKQSECTNREPLDIFSFKK